MISVGVRELKQRTSKLIRLVREEGKEIRVTYRGKVVAVIVPVPSEASANAAEAAWGSLDALAAEIGARWPEGKDSLDAVTEVRK